MKKTSRIFIAVLCLMLLAGCISPAFAATAPFETYTYSMNGEPMQSPDAYVPERIITNYDMGVTALKSAKDIFFDADGNLYVSDTGNNRVLVCDADFKCRFEISSFINEHGVPDTLSAPQGLFVNNTTIYICDTNNSRIVCFDKTSGDFERIIYAPEAELMGEDTIFHPVAISVNACGSMCVVSDQTYSGVFYLDEDGKFICFVGAQQADVPLATRIRRLIFPDVTSVEYVTATYNNCTIDADGFIYVTTSDIDDATLASAIASGNSTYAPVKRLNSVGDDVMRRNGFFIPAGEVSMTGSATTLGAVTGPSKIIDVALGEDGMWTIIDSKRCRMYTYDADGKLLFAFGDKGAQLGNLSQPTAIAYRGSSLYVLDATLNTITVYKRTDYGDIIAQALKHTSDRQFSAALSDWEAILKANNNFDSAYIGIGENLFRQGDEIEGAYKESLVYFKAAGDVASYSNAFKEIRKDWVEKYVFVVIIVIIVLCVAIVKFLKYVGKKNKEGVTKLGKRTLWEEFIYGFYLIMHPFDAYWDLKHEKRGSVRGALLIDVIVVISYIYYTVGRSYIFNPDKGRVSIIFSILTVAVPLVLWCVANWCLTTLFDGEGNFKDIFISSSYALFPLIIFMIPVTIVTNISSLDESKMISLLLSISFVWLGMLLFFGSATTHGYSMGKNILITVATIVGMMFIMFIVMLFSNLIQQMVSFVADIITEVSLRV